MRQTVRRATALVAVIAFAITALLFSAAPAGAATLPNGFGESVAFSGLTLPTVVKFSPDGRVFVAEKSGLIKVFDNLSDTTPTTVADFRTAVDDYWDRGLLGLALDPNFPANPYIYALYAYDAPIGGTAPVWNDACPSPPGPTTDGCVVSGRLVRFQVSGDVITGSPQVLINDWCQQYPSHATGALNFGPDGALYASGGDGASFTFLDYGQGGGSAGSPTPKNPCGDPPVPVGGSQTAPTAEGGSLRSQSPRRPAGEPVLLNGSIIRVDPATGQGLPDNPGAGSADANMRRIVAYGMRNPFRFTFRPGTSELWVGDVGQGAWEEIDRHTSPTGSMQNFGWPCYEGNPQLGGWGSLSLCSTLYSAGTATAPYYAYNHSSTVVSGETCPTGSSSISGMAFYTGSSYPASYNGALFFADHSRNCIWAMPTGSNGLPDPSARQTFAAGASNPVDIEVGPGGDLFYVDFEGGTVRRIQFSSVSPTSSYLSDLTPTSETNGWGPYEKDRSNGEAAAGDGVTQTLNGTTYAKGLGVHAVSDLRYNLGGGCSRFKASVGIDDEVGNAGSVAFQVYADAAQVYDSTTMTGATATKDVDVSVAGAQTLRLAVTNGGDNLNNDHGDWALARIECGSDTTAPTISSRTPAAGASGVAMAVRPTATFSEPVNPATLTASTFTLLKNGTATPISAAVSYDDPSRTATLTPGANLEASTTYTATVKGGASGVKDLAGNPLAADSSWSFATGTANPPSSTYLSDLTPTSATNGWGPYEKDRSNGEKAAGDGVTQKLNGTTYAKGLGVHAASDLRYNLGGSCSRFKASVGVDDEVGSAGSVVFQVFRDSTKVYDSAKMTGATATKSVDVSVAGGTTLRLVVTNGGDNLNSDHGDWALARIECGNNPPTPVIDSPAPTLTWAVGDPISFTGHATDPESGSLGASALSWTLIVRHCPSGPSSCHGHTIQNFNGVAGGSFGAPDHDYPSYLDLVLTATDPGGLQGSTTLRLDPRTVNLTIASNPTGLTLGLNSSTATAPFTATVIQGSINTLVAPSPQVLGGATYQWLSWSDGAAATHNITANSSATYTANYGL